LSRDRKPCRGRLTLSLPITIGYESAKPVVQHDYPDGTRL
jgi:hypothetical protein